MSENKYEECLSWSKQKGLELDHRVERKKVNGVYGMYATAPIPKGTVVASFPVKSTMSIRTDFKYPDKTHKQTKWIHAAAIMLSEGKNSENSGYVKMFETPEELHSNCAFYFSNEEYAFLQKMNPLCYTSLLVMRTMAINQLKIIHEIDPKLDLELIMQAILNGFSRVWTEYGFLPIIDLFNHSNTEAASLGLTNNNKSVGYTTTKDYVTDEQVWGCYGMKDMYSHAAYYNYFDPNSTHIIDYGSRAIQTISNPAVTAYIAQIYKCQFIQWNGEKKFRILEPNLFFLENEPSKELMSYLTNTSFCTNKEFLEKKCSHHSIYTTLLYIINSFLDANKVDNYKLAQVPQKLRRFHQLLKKEKKIMQQNLDWATKQL